MEKAIEIIEMISGPIDGEKFAVLKLVPQLRLTLWPRPVLHNDPIDYHTPKCTYVYKHRPMTLLYDFIGVE